MENEKKGILANKKNKVFILSVITGVGETSANYRIFHQTNLGFQTSSYSVSHVFSVNAGANTFALIADCGVNGNETGTISVNTLNGLFTPVLY